MVHNREQGHKEGVMGIHKEMMPQQVQNREERPQVTVKKQ